MKYFTTNISEIKHRHKFKSKNKKEDSDRKYAV